MLKRYWLVVAALRAALLYRNHASLKQVYANVRAFDLPSARMHDALVAPLLEGLYARAAEEVAASFPSGTVLGSGPGRLAARLTRTALGLEITGADLSRWWSGRSVARRGRTLSQRSSSYACGGTIWHGLPLIGIQKLTAP